LDRRKPKHELVIIDCSTIVAELSGSEFFGHKQGAYTGAVGSRTGAFQIADGGTLFLDEVGELPLGLQSQLLRVVQEGSYKRVGGNKWRTTNFRLICATNHDLSRGVEKGHFRADLYYRLADWVFHLPPLSERPEDILLLTRHFLAKLDQKFVSIEIDDLVRQHLLNRTYPGNIRELRQLVRRIGQRHVGTGPISIGDIPEDERPENRPQLGNWRDEQFYIALRRALAMGLDLKKINQFTKDTAIAIAVDEENGNLQKAAHKLGVTDRMLQMHRASNRR
jgi:transcriptional regulator with GAF, ATPase, and Fis domain